MGLCTSDQSHGDMKKPNVAGRPIDVKRVIGEGGFSYIYEVKHRQTGRIYALKRILAQTSEQMNQAMAESEIHRKVGPHPNILSLEDFWIAPSKQRRDAQDVCFLMPCYKNGSLQRCIERKSPEMTEAFALRLFEGICKGVQEFHKLGLVHRDIKPGNVLLTDNWEPVLMDFGSASTARIRVTNRKQALSIQEAAAEQCTASYRAPELWDVPSDAQLDERTDIWSLGCTLYALGSDRSPFESAMGYGGSMMIAVMSGNIPFEKDYPFSTAYREMVLWLLNKNAQQRPFIDEVIARTISLRQQLSQSPSLPRRSPSARLSVPVTEDFANFDNASQV
eukprot:GILJ01004990.1.p1 GENE.GILJ01004990.1~~GILJ01004990.1.p1  ORF type:complete len:335 (+),score=32.31 GILJ01004990.1:123-1127(+)